MKGKTKVDKGECKNEEKTEDEDYSVENHVSCPVCGEAFQSSLEAGKVSEHINHCLDKSNQKDGGKKDNNSGSDGLLYSELVVHALRNRESEVFQKEQNTEEIEVFYCHICQKDLTRMNSQRRRQHINSCCDKAEALEHVSTRQSTRNKSTASDQLICPLCNKQFKSVKTRQAHIKRCSQKKGVPIDQVLQLVHGQANQKCTMENQRSVTQEQRTNINRNSARRKPKTSVKNLDEQTQLALALSASMAPSAPKAKVSRRKGQKKKEQLHEVPALLLRSDDNMKKVIAERAAQVICPQDDDEDEISCTPALPPSKLANQFKASHHQTGKEDDDVNSNSGENQQVQSGALRKVTEANNCVSKTDKDVGTGNYGSVKSKDAGTTDEKSDGLTDQDDLSESNVCGTSFISKSFFNFLNDSDDDDTEKVEALPSKLNSSGCVLWSLTALPTKLQPQSFYVPGLLPNPVVSEGKKTLAAAGTHVRSTSTTSALEYNVDDHMEVNENADSDTAAKTNSLHLKDATRDGRRSVDQLTASQMASVELLAELACDGSSSDITIATQKVGSVNEDDDGEVFPSSGFCVPVTQKDRRSEVCQHSTLQISSLAQDLSEMINNPLFSDVTIVAKNNKQISAHKVILAARCQEFGKLLNTKCTMDESGKCWLYLRDVTSDALLVVLKYLYTGSYDFPPDITDSVEIVAERFQLIELIEACRDIGHNSVVEQKEVEEHQSSPHRADFNNLANQVFDLSLEGTNPIENDLDDQLGQDELGFDDEDIEEIRIFQTQAIRQTKKSSIDCLGSVLETMAESLSKENDKTDGILEGNSTKSEDVFGKASASINENNLSCYHPSLSEVVDGKEKYEYLDVKENLKVETQGGPLNQLKSRSEEPIVVGKCLELETEFSEVKIPDDVLGGSNLLQHTNNQLSRTKTGSESTNNRCNQPFANDKSENDSSSLDTFYPTDSKCMFDKDVGDFTACFNDVVHKPEISSSKVNSNSFLLPDMDASTRDFEHMSVKEGSPVDDLKGYSNKTGLEDEEDSHKEEVSHQTVSISNALGDKSKANSFKLEETNEIQKVDLMSTSEKQEGDYEFYEDQTFSYQDLPSPPAVGCEEDINNFHKDSDEENSSFVQNESICLLSGDDSDHMDKSLEEANLDANIVPETPALTERLVSSKQFSLTVQRDSSTADGHNSVIKNKEERVFPDLIYSGSSQISRDQEAKEFLAKLKNRSNKEKNGSRKRKRDCMSFKSSPAKKRPFKSFSIKGSYSLQSESKTTSSKESSRSEQEEEEEAPMFLSSPENHSNHPSSVPISILETKLLPSSSCTGELQANAICSVYTPKGRELTSKNDVCFSDASLKSQLSPMGLRSKLNDSTLNSTTLSDITMKDKNQTFYTPDASDRVSSMISPPVLSPDYSFTPMNFSPGSPEPSELLVGTPVIKTFFSKSPKRIELDASPKSPTPVLSPDYSFTPMNFSPGSLEASEQPVGTPVRNTFSPKSPKRIELDASPESLTPVLSPNYSLTPMNFSPGSSEASELPVGTPVRNIFSPKSQKRIELDASPESPTPVLSPDYSFASINFSPGSPEALEQPVGTPVINTFSPKSSKRIEVDASPKSPASPEFPNISVGKTRSPKGKASVFTAKVLNDSSPNSPSVPLSYNLQLSKSHTNRPTTAKALSFVRSEDRKTVSSHVHSSGEDSESNENDITSDHLPTPGCYMSSSNSSAKTIINKAETSGKTVEKNKDELKTSNINFKMSLCERLSASRYGISSEVESDYNNDCGTLDRNVDTQSNSDYDGDMLQDETKVDDIFSDDYDFVYEDGGYNCDNELESADLSNEETDPNCCFNIDTPKPIQKSENREKTTPISSKRNKGNPVKGKTSYISVKQPAHNMDKDAQKPKRQFGKGANSYPNKKPITPMADYDCMNTPELKNELRSYGVRQLAKKKMIAKLKEIYHYTHQEPGKDESIFDEAPPGVVVPKVLGVPKPQNGAYHIQDKTDYASSESEYETQSSRTGTEAGTASSNQESDDESEEFGDVTMEIEDPTEEITASQQVNNVSLQERLREYITTSKELYIQVLHYKPLDLVAVHQQIKSSGIACSLGKLVDFLDLQGITFSTANSRQRGTRTRQKVKKNSKTRKNIKTTR